MARRATGSAPTALAGPGDGRRGQHQRQRCRRHAREHAPGGHDRFGRLIVDDNVRAFLAFGGPALKAVWNGTAAGVPQTRDTAQGLCPDARLQVRRSGEPLLRHRGQAGSEGAAAKSRATPSIDVYLPLSSRPGPDAGAGSRHQAADASTTAVTRPRPLQAPPPLRPAPRSDRKVSRPPTTVVSRRPFPVEGPFHFAAARRLQARSELFGYIAGRPSLHDPAARFVRSPPSDLDWT